MASTVLSEIRVLDLTRVRSGPTAVRQYKFKQFWRKNG